jgi:hypothetical protein
MLAGQMKTPRLLVALLANPERADVLCRPIILAAAVLPELRRSPVDGFDPLITRITETIVDAARTKGRNEMHEIYGDALSALTMANGTYRNLPFREWLLCQVAAKDPEVFGLLIACGSAAATPDILVVLKRLLRDEDDHVRLKCGNGGE